MSDVPIPGVPSETGEPPPPWSMRTYVLTFLYRGAYSPADPAKAEELQRAHLAYFHTLRRSGKMILAGPFLDEGELRGICLYDSDSVEEVRAICLKDPAVIAGAFRVDVHPWYAAKGITFVPPAGPSGTDAGALDVI